MKKDVKHSFFHPSGCLSQEAFSKYLYGELSKGSKKMIEGHLYECEICMHAFNGFKSQISRDQFTKNNLLLQERMVDRVFGSDYPKRIRPLIYRRAVAILLPLVALSIYLLSNNVKGSTENYSKRYLGANVISNDTLIIYEDAFVVKNDMLVHGETLPKALQNKYSGLKSGIKKEQGSSQSANANWIPVEVYDGQAATPVKIMVRTF